MNTILKHSVVIIMTLILYGSSGSAQIRIGIRGGINASKVKSDDFITTDHRLEFSKNARTGFHAGIITQFQKQNVFLQPEVLFSSVRNDILIYDLLSGKEDLTELVLNKIDIPVLVGYKWEALKFEAGPVASIIISDKSELMNLTEYDMLLKKATIGFQAGIGFDVSKLALDLKYEGSLSNFSEGITVGGKDFKFDPRSRQFIFSIGLFF
jgi:hypothetical protein